MQVPDALPAGRLDRREQAEGKGTGACVAPFPAAGAEARLRLQPAAGDERRETASIAGTTDSARPEEAMIQNPIRERNIRSISQALPGTSAEIAEESGLSRKTVRRYLAAWLSQGTIVREVRHLSQHAYTWVYSRVWQ